jgi:hypothetical protein
MKSRVEKVRLYERESTTQDEKIDEYILLGEQEMYTTLLPAELMAFH